MTYRAFYLSLILCLGTACADDSAAIVDTKSQTDDSGDNGDPNGDSKVDADGDGVVASEDCNDGDATVHTAVKAYVDNDEDGYTDETAVELCTAGSLPAGYLAKASAIADCDDGNPALHTSLTGYLDADADGYTTGNAVSFCTAGSLPANYVASASETPDCDDGDNGVHTNVATYADLDGDGYTVDEVTVFCTDPALPSNPDYKAETSEVVDCDDDDELVHTALTGYRDADLDGYTAGEAVELCTDGSLPAGYQAEASAGEDCNDASNTINPGRLEVYYDGIDNDCNLATVDNDQDGDGHTVDTDCDDTDGLLHTSLTGYLDQDGDGYTVGSQQTLCTAGSLPSDYTATASATDDCDDTLSSAYLEVTGYLDEDGDGYTVGTQQTLCTGGSLPSTYTADASDADDCNDADGASYLETTFYADNDGDGYGDPGAAQLVCADETPSVPAGHVTDGNDCDDGDENVKPGAVELAEDGVDNDCSAGDASAASGAGLYVDAAAVCDGSEDGSQAAPFCTISDATAIAVDGDNIFVAEGVYNEAPIISSAARLYGGYDPATWTRPDDYRGLSRIESTAQQAVQVSWSSSATVEGYAVVDGFYAEAGDGAFNSRGIFVYDHGRAFLLNNEAIGGAATGNSSGVQVGSSGEAVLVDNHLRGGTGLTAIGLSAGGLRTVAVGNLLESGVANSGSGSIGLAAIDGQVVAMHNVMTGDSASGAAGVRTSGGRTLLANNHISGWAGVRVLTGSDVALVHNNLQGSVVTLVTPDNTSLYDLDRVNGCPVDGFTAEHGCHAWTTGNIDVDPAFVDEAGDDYHVDAFTSGLIDVGIDPHTLDYTGGNFVDPTPWLAVDPDGNPRPLEAGYDIGVYESKPSTVYVDAGAGDDDTGDGTQGAPWATINHAIAHSAEGALINLAEGTYREDVVLDGVTKRISGGFDPAVWGYDGMTGFVTSTVIEPAVSQIAINVKNGAHLTLYGTTVRGNMDSKTSSIGVSVSQASAILSTNYIHGGNGVNSSKAVSLYGTSYGHTGDLTLVYNIIDGGDGAESQGIYVNQVSNLAALNNVITGGNGTTSSHAVRTGTGSMLLTLISNDLWDAATGLVNGFTSVADINGCTAWTNGTCGAQTAGNISADPGYIDAYFRIDENSALWGAGTWPPYIDWNATGAPEPSVGIYSIDLQGDLRPNDFVGPTIGIDAP